MKFVLVLILIICTCAIGSDTSRLYYRLEDKSGIVDIFVRLNLYPLYGENGYVTRTLKLNPLISKLGINSLPKNFLIRLPPLPIKKSNDWIISKDMLIFKQRNHSLKESHTTNITNNYYYADKPKLKMPLAFRAHFGTQFEKSFVVDQGLRKGELKFDKNWSFNSDLIYKLQGRSLSLGFSYEDIIYADGTTINWANDRVKRLDYRIELLERFNNNYILGAGIGKRDLLSFKTLSIGNLEILRQSRFYAKVILGLNFKLLIPIKSLFNFSLLESLDIDGVKFDIGYEASLNMSTAIKSNNGSDILILSEIGFRDDVPNGFKQKTYFVYFGFGFQWGGNR